jgi:DNA-binding CsgD family transcriptional regulator
MDIDTWTRWNRDLAAVLEQIDRPDVLCRLDEAIRLVARFDISVGFAYPEDREPILLYDGLKNTAPTSALDAYLRGTYLLDPFYLACSNQILPGLYRMAALAPDNFFNSDYYLSPAVHPCISMESGSLDEEIGFFVPLPAGFMATYSLMRSNGSAAFSDEEFARLTAIEPMVRFALSRHWRFVSKNPDARSRRTWSIHGEAMEEAFERFAADRLTPRQRLIVQLILRGHSNLSISLRLGITEGTAKIHRKAIYDRLEISSQSELFGMFIDFLVTPRGA